MILNIFHSYYIFHLLIIYHWQVGSRMQLTVYTKHAQVCKELQLLIKVCRELQLLLMFEFSAGSS